MTKVAMTIEQAVQELYGLLKIQQEAIKGLAESHEITMARLKRLEDFVEQHSVLHNRISVEPN